MEKQTNQVTSGGFIWNLSIIHLGLAIAPIVLGIISYRTVQDSHFTIAEADNLFLIVVPVFTLSCIFTGHFIFKQSVKNIHPTTSLKQQLMQFQTACIINYALVESAMLFGIASFFIKQNLIFIALSTAILFYFFLIRPTKQKIARDLNLKGVKWELFNRLHHPLDS
ncbi:hypothetical protein [Flagellimonas sp. 2504JD1-5]